MRSSPSYVLLSMLLSLGSCGSSEELSPSDCSDGIDNDGDGTSDCDDLACAIYTFCAPMIDAGNPRSDAGLTVDSGDRIDAGGPPDSGASIDSGSGPDAGALDGGPFDGGPFGFDAVVGDGAIVIPPVIDMCAPPIVGRIGGTCRGGTMCVTGLTCAEEITSVMGAPLTLATFGIASGTPDPANPGEFIAGPLSSIAVGFAPDGQCTFACDPGAADPGCGLCAACSDTVGGSPVFDQVGLSVGRLSFLPTSAQPGICRASCTYEPGSNGGCPAGYTCDVTENVCVEACVSDAQCNLEWGVSRSAGLVAAQIASLPYSCSPTTGRCEWTAPPLAAIGSACNLDADCPADLGICLVGGRCSQWSCNLSDDGTTPLYPCAIDQICLSFPGADPPPSLCIDTCTGPEDCFPDQSCRDDLLSGGSSICWFNCEDDTQCRSTQRCELGRFRDPTVGRCNDPCTPGGSPSGCTSDELCEPVAGVTYGFCVPLDQLCFSDDTCNDGQACRVESDDLWGRCVDGCMTSAECTVTEECVIQPGSGSGVCRAPGQACSPSPLNTAGAPSQPLRGDAQCVASERCGGVSPPPPDVLGTCS